MTDSISKDPFQQLSFMIRGISVINDTSWESAEEKEQADRFIRLYDRLISTSASFTIHLQEYCENPVQVNLKAIETLRNVMTTCAHPAFLLMLEILTELFSNVHITPATITKLAHCEELCEEFDRRLRIVTESNQVPGRKTIQ